MSISESPKTNIFRISNTIYSSQTFTNPQTPSTPHQTFSLSIMEENIENAESIITKWDSSSTQFAKLTSLFHHNRKVAEEFLKSVKDLRRAMHFLVIENSTSRKLVLAQKLMQIAMKRLEKEFYQILSTKSDHLDHESVSDQSLGGSIDSGDDYEVQSKDAMSNLKLIADCMISSGYSKECAKIYKIVRKSRIDEALYSLGIKKFKSSQIQKLNWEKVEYVIKNWKNSIKKAVREIFSRERILCDHVFSASQTIRESCFYEITKSGAINLFKFPELITKRIKAPGKIFSLMELYEAISDLWPEIESIFNLDSTSPIRLQALSSIFKLGDSVSSILSEFESTIQKDSSKNTVFGGGIDSLTQSAMSYISTLADYNVILSTIIYDYPPPRSSPFPESYFESPTENESSMTVLATHLAWLILVLLCKIDNKSELYKEVSLSYLFLANNLHFVVERVCTTKLRHILGDGWVSTHTKKVKQYAINFESTAWNKVLSSLPDKTSEISSQMVKESFTKFNAAFQEAFRKQTSWMVQDGKLRDELKVSIARKIVPVYKEFYYSCSTMLSGEKNLELLVRYTPEDLGNYFSNLFNGSCTSGSSTLSSSSSLLYSRGCLLALPR